MKGIGVLSMFFPFLRHVVRECAVPVKSFYSNTVVHKKPIGRNVINNRSKAVMERVGALMVMEKKAEVERLGESGSVGGKDLLSLLVRANLQESPAGRLDDKTLSAGELDFAFGWSYTRPCFNHSTQFQKSPLSFSLATKRQRSL